MSAIPSNVRLKLERAARHFQELEPHISDFLAGEPYSVIAKPDTDANDTVLVVRVAAHPPEFIGVIVGDCLFDLRSCLDNLVCAVSSLAGGDCEGTEFPIFLDSDLFHETDKKGQPTRRSGLYKTRFLDAPSRAKIKSLQPFASRKSPLWILHELNRRDKHRVIHGAATTMAAGAVKVIHPSRPGADIEPVYQQFRGPFKDGAEIGRFHCVGCEPSEVYVDGEITMTVGFDWGSEPAEGLPILQTLRDCIADVAHVVDDFEAMFP